MRSFFALTVHLSLACTLWRLADAALYTDPNTLPQDKYDFIIVGGASRRLNPLWQYILTLCTQPGRLATCSRTGFQRAAPIPSLWWKRGCRMYRFPEVRVKRPLTVSSSYAGMKWIPQYLSLSLHPLSPQTHLLYGITRLSPNPVFSTAQSTFHAVASWADPVHSVSSTYFIL